MPNIFTDLQKCLKRNRVRLRNTIFGIIILTLVILMIIFVCFYITTFDDLLPSNRGELGQLGDYFGGLLNPIFGFASFLALLATIFYQSKELKLSRNELELTRTELANSAIALGAQIKAIELQSFEQTFFSWLNSYHELLKSIEDDNITYKRSNSGDVIRDMLGESVVSVKNGRAQLYFWWERSLNEKAIWRECESSMLKIFPENSIHKAMQLKCIPREYKGYLLALAELHKNDVIEIILINWNKLYSEQEYQLDSMIRTLYRLIYWVDTQHELSPAQKWLYINIIRSQLSWVELSYLFLNGLTKRGNKFKFLIEKYAILDNLTFESDATLEVLTKYSIEDIQYAKSAFNSEVAREKLGLPKSSEDTLALATSTAS